MRGFEITFALLAPFLTLGLLGFAFFLYAAVRRNRWPLVLYGAGYTIVSWVTLFLGDNPPPADDIFYPIFFLSCLAAMMHGLAIALSDDPIRSRRRREQARHYAQLHPEHARRSGVGRPDLARPYDDGGLVDLNHASDHELAGLPGVGAQNGYRIAADRAQRGPYTRPEDLIARGLLAPEALAGLTSYLICLPPLPTVPPPDLYQPSPHTPPGAYTAPVQYQPPPEPYRPPNAGIQPDPEYPAPADPWSDAAN